MSNTLASQEEFSHASTLRVLEECPGAGRKDAGTGFGSPRPLPPGVVVRPSGPVYYQEWVAGPGGARGWIGGALLAVALAIGGAWLARDGRAVIGASLLAAGVMSLVTAASFRGLSLVIDARGVAWSFGPLFRRRYRLEEVQMFRVRELVFRKFGGWGIGRAHDGVDVYQVWGANGTALDLVVKRGGVTRHYLISSVAPDQACASIVRASLAAQPRSTSNA